MAGNKGHRETYAFVLRDVLCGKSGRIADVGQRKGSS